MAVSVVVPFYNSEDTIASCIESVLSQTFGQIELILVDDGSTDKSGAICDEYAHKDSRVCVIHQQNKGRSEARFIGVNQSSGEWVAFVDSDDKLSVSAIEYLYAKADDSVEIVFGNGNSLPNEHREMIPINDFRHLAVRAEGTIGVPWGSLYRRKVLKPYLFELSREIINGEDYIFWLRLVFSTEKPVNIVYENVYLKGDDHTSNSFKWTAAYCESLDQLRLSSIPDNLREEYFGDILHDRITNLFAVCTCQSRREWTSSKFYQDIVKDMKERNICFTNKQLFFLSLPSIYLRQLYSKFSNYLHSL